MLAKREVEHTNDQFIFVSMVREAQMEPVTKTAANLATWRASLAAHLHRIFAQIEEFFGVREQVANVLVVHFEKRDRHLELHRVLRGDSVRVMKELLQSQHHDARLRGARARSVRRCFRSRRFVAPALGCQSSCKFCPRPSGHRRRLSR